jgi:hypothetical protein
MESVRKRFSQARVQRGDGSCFPFESLAMLLPDLPDGHNNARARVPRLPHFSHATCADGREEFAGAELASGDEVHKASVSGRPTAAENISRSFGIILLLPSERRKLLLFENLNHTGVVALSVLAVYDSAKAFSVLREHIPALNCERANNFDKFPGT